MNSSPLARGEKVRVVKGPLTGLVGELVNVDGKSKIAVRLLPSNLSGIKSLPYSEASYLPRLQKQLPPCTHK